MNSETKNKQIKRRHLSIWSGFIFLLMVFFWLLTYFWGTKEVHQNYVKLNRIGLPAQYRLFEDRRPDDVNTVWVLIAYPRAPLPFIVSLEVDKGVSCLWGGPVRQYFFWFAGYHSKTPFWGREVYGTYEEND